MRLKLQKNSDIRCSVCRQHGLEIIFMNMKVHFKLLMEPDEQDR